MFLSGLDTTDRFARSLVGEIPRPFVEDCGQGLHQRWSITGMTWMDPFRSRNRGPQKLCRNERFSRRQTDRFARFDALHVRSHDLYSRLHTFLPSFLASKFNALPANMNPA